MRLCLSGRQAIIDTVIIHINHCIRQSGDRISNCIALFTYCPLIFSARCNLYISCLCYDASVRLSVTLCALWSQGAMDPGYFASLDIWMSLLLTCYASFGSSDWMMPGFLVKEGGRKNGICEANAKYLALRLAGNRCTIAYILKHLLLTTS